MAGRGGYQPPSNPAPVSGTGSSSKRTDGSVRDQVAKGYIPNMPGQYGQGAQLNADAAQGNALTAQANAGQGGGIEAMLQHLSDLNLPTNPTALNAPTDNPSQHVMSGVDAGPGNGSAALQLPSQSLENMQDDQKLAQLLATMQQVNRTNPEVSNASIRMQKLLQDALS